MDATKIKYGQIGFGTVNNTGPTHWRYGGTRNGAHILEQVKHPSASTTGPDQFVSQEVVERIMRDAD